MLDDLYAPFISAIRKGDIREYDETLDRQERRLVELNLWLTLEKARELCIRGLFRRVYVYPFYFEIIGLTLLSYRWVSSDKSTRIPVSMFHTGLQVAGSDVPMEEAECLVANMIYRGYMRGYISHEKQMVVLANTNTFPRLADRSNPFAQL